MDVQENGFEQETAHAEPDSVTGTETTTLRARDGSVLHARRRRAPSEAAVAVIVHGFAEHCGRYEHVQARLADQRIASLAFDLRGHGRSGGRRGHVARFGDYLDDLDVACAAAADLAPGRPLVLLGHSFGGLVAAVRAMRRPDTASALLLSSPALRFLVRVPWPLRAAARVLALLWPTFSQPARIDVDRLTHDPEATAAVRRDPLRFDRATVRWYVEARRAQREVLARPELLCIPTYVAVAGQDALVDESAVERLARRAPDTTVRRWPGCYHELLQEVERDQVLDEMLAWLRGVLDQTSGGGSRPGR